MIGDLALVVTAATVALVPGVVAVAPGLVTLAETDSERAYTTVARGLLATGDIAATGGLIDGRLSPLVPWLQAATAWVAGFGADAPIAVLRAPSAVAAVLALVLTYGLGRILSGAGARLAVALLLAATPLFGLVGRTAGADALVMAATVAALLPLASAYRAETPPSIGRSLLFWGAIGFGILVGGAFVPVVVAMALLVLMVIGRSLAVPRALHPLWGFAGLIFLAGGPLVALMLTSAPDLFADYGRTLSTRVLGGAEGRALPGVYGLVAIAAFWPAVALVPIAAAHLMAKQVSTGSRFLLAALLPAWVLIEAFAFKRTADMAPLLPLLALVVGLTVAEGGLARTTGWRKAVLGWIALGGLIAVIGLNAAFVATVGRADVIGIVGAVAVGAVAIAAWRILVTGRTWPGLLATVFAGLLAGVLGFGWLLPADTALWNQIEHLTLGGGISPIPPATATNTGF